MAKNIVICLDGTGDFAAANPTHVFRLFRALERSDQQMVYYNGGVGTLRNSAALSPWAKSFLQALDLAAGFSIEDVFIEAYSFLVRNFEEGDAIYLIGFSRGAYTARALAGAIHYFGLFYPEQVDIVPYIWQQYSSIGEDTASESPAAWRTMRRMEGAFGRPAGVKFLGVWDTVSSFGFIKLRTLPQTHKLESVGIVRHAVSLDERRNMFPENLCNPSHPNLKEVWFAGVHRDVGGGGAADALSLSMIPFNWLLAEAEANGLLIDPVHRAKMEDVPENPCGKDNGSLLYVIVYAFFGLLPMKWWSNAKHRFAWRWLYFWHVRKPPPGSVVHNSVKARMACPDLRYRPCNLDRNGEPPPGP